MDLYGIGGVYQLESIGDLNCLAVLDLFRSHVEGGFGFRIVGINDSTEYFFTILICIGDHHVVEVVNFTGIVSASVVEEQSQASGGLISADLNSILWLNAPVIACGVIAIARYRKWIAALDASALFLTIPPIAKLLAGFATSVALIELAYFSGRLLLTLIRDIDYRKSHITRPSIMESMKGLPDGILCSDAYGDILFMNDKMRFYLRQLEMPADLSDANSIRRELMARGTKLNVLKPGLGSVSTSLSLSSTMVCLFVFDKMTIRNREYLRVIAYDITEKAKLAQEIEEANSRLEETAIEILDSISALRNVAETQAMFQMRSRVHDIIGQRLSIVHRLLESGDYSDESIRHMQPLLKGILNDLLPASGLCPKEDLLLMKSTLGMAGVTLSFHGKLPNDESVAKAMVLVLQLLDFPGQFDREVR